MKKSGQSDIDALLMQEKIEYMEDAYKRLVEYLYMLTTSREFVKNISACREPASIVSAAACHIKQLLPFQEIAFYLIDEADSDFSIAFCDPGDKRDALQQDVDATISNGTFAWALRQNRPVIVPSGRKGLTLIFHVLSTQTRIRGMFVGTIETSGLGVTDPSVTMLSATVQNIAYGIESAVLYKILMDKNASLENLLAERKQSEVALRIAHDELEERVRQRTSELLASNEQLRHEIAERRLAEEELKKQSEELLLLSDSSSSLTGITSAENLYNAICQNALKLFDLEMAWIGLVGDDDFTVRPAAFTGFEEGYLSAIKITWDDLPTSLGPTGTAIKTETPCLLTTDDPRFDRWREDANRRGYASILSVPLIDTRRKCVGALTLYNRSFDYFTINRINLCQIFANHAAICIENVKMLEGLEKTVDKKTGELEAANTERDKLFNAIEQAAEAIVITDPCGKIQYSNPAFSAVTGYSREEALGKNPKILNSGKNPPELFRDLWKTILSGGIWKGTLINRRKTGELYYDEMIVTPVISRQGGITNFIAIKNDVTDRIKAEEELKQKNIELEAAKRAADSANRAKSEFLANMSHELRTPLNAVLGYSDIILTGLSGEITAEQKEFIENINKSGHHLLKLINEILDLSKVEAGKMELEYTEVHLEKIFDESLLFVREVAIRHGILLTTTVDGDARTVPADEKKLKQILVNLLSNAVKFTPDGGRITIRARKASFHYIGIIVEDTGTGIRPEDMDKLFVPFQQLETPYEKKHQGTGLGLALCKKIMELHGGRIWAESEYGKGSRFILEIPAKRREEAE